MIFFSPGRIKSLRCENSFLFYFSFASTGIPIYYIPTHRSVGIEQLCVCGWYIVICRGLGRPCMQQQHNCAGCVRENFAGERDPGHGRMPLPPSAVWPSSERSRFLFSAMEE